MTNVRDITRWTTERLSSTYNSLFQLNHSVIGALGASIIQSNGNEATEMFQTSTVNPLQYSPSPSSQNQRKKSPKDCAFSASNDRTRKQNYGILEMELNQVA